MVGCALQEKEEKKQNTHTLTHTHIYTVCNRKANELTAKCNRERMLLLRKGFWVRVGLLIRAKHKKNQPYTEAKEKKMICHRFAYQKKFIHKSPIHLRHRHSASTWDTYPSTTGRLQDALKQMTAREKKTNKKDR